MAPERRDKKPTWWLLYAIAFLLLGLLGLIEVFVPAGLHAVLEVAVVVAMFWLMAQWLRRNRAALELEQGRGDR